MITSKTKVEKNIYKYIVYEDPSKTQVKRSRYAVIIKRDKKVFSKYFHTLSDAQAFKKHILSVSSISILPLSFLELSSRCKKILSNYKINSCEKLLSLSYKELYEIDPLIVKEVYEALRALILGYNCF